MKFLPLLLLLVGCADVQPIGREGPFSPVYVVEYWECEVRDGDEITVEVYSCALDTGPPYFDPNVRSCVSITSDTTGTRPRDCNCCE